jgi:hypothetical protein
VLIDGKSFKIMTCGHHVDDREMSGIAFLFVCGETAGQLAIVLRQMRKPVSVTTRPDIYNIY